MSILAQIIGLACLLFWGFWLCCKLRLPAGFAPLCGLCFCMVVLQLAGSCNQLWLGAQLLLVGAVLTLAQRRRHEILPQLLSPGVLAFCSAAGVLMAVFAIRQPEFQTWDEFSHWGIYFKSVFYQHRFAVWDTTRSLAHQAYPQGLPGLYALFALPAAQYREADVLFVTALPLAAAASALFALPQVTARQIEQPGVRQTERRCYGQSGCIREESARKETKAEQRCLQRGSGVRQDLALEPDRSRAPGQGQAGLPAGIPP